MNEPVFTQSLKLTRAFAGVTHDSVTSRTDESPFPRLVLWMIFVQGLPRTVECYVTSQTPAKPANTNKQRSLIKQQHSTPMKDLFSCWISDCNCPLDSFSLISEQQWLTAWLIFMCLLLALNYFIVHWIGFIWNKYISISQKCNL